MTWTNPEDYCAKRVDSNLYDIKDLSQAQRESLNRSIKHSLN